MQGNKKLKLFLVPLFFLFISIDFILAQGELEVQIPVLSTALPSLPDYIKAVFNLSLMVVGLIAFFAVISGGFRYLTAGSSAVKMADAVDQIGAGILGLIIILSSYLILTTINPQLVVLHLPAIEEHALTALSPFDFEKAPSSYQTIPVGTIIDSKVLNKSGCKIINKEHCQKLLDKSQCQTVEINKCNSITCEDPGECELLKKVSDLDNILYVAEKTKGYAETLKDASNNLRNLINQCKCQNTNKGYCVSAPCGGEPFECVDRCNPCTGEPCPNRASIERKREQIKLFTAAFEAFLDRTTYKGEDYETVERLINDSSNDYDDDINAFTNLKNLVYEMRNIENKNGGLKEIIKNFENESKKTLIAETLMKECQRQPISYNNMLTLEDILREEEKEVIKKNFCNNPNFQTGMTCEEEESILPFADSSTFYCFIK